MKCTVVIPTYNRPNHLKRILSYYHQYGKNLPVLIADSSTEENKSLNRETVATFLNTSFSYIDKYDSNTHPYHKILDALKRVSTKYCTLCADDDFVTPNGIMQSVDFLEHNPDFTVAHGRYIRFKLEDNGPDTKFLWYNDYLPPKINTSSKPASKLNDINDAWSIAFPGAVDRLRYRLLDYPLPTYYAVHRTDFFRLAWEETLKATDDILFAELLYTMLTLIHGKMKCLDVLYGARSPRVIVYDRHFDKYSAAKYKEGYTKFKSCSAMHLSEMSELDIAASGKVIDDTWAVYMKKLHYSRKLAGIKVLLSHLPVWMDKGIIKLYRRYLRPWHYRDSPVFADKPPSPEYNNDFEQIRQTVLLHGCE